ncbi:MAG: class II aldolase/adducin family protein [Gemmatimonadota bacterium]|nr:class II aldolase/adducin family protein [Gemmatimonadota bacterium]MDH5803809.1 class II aldolase/adducin family protein [Gemmatimonadota bacterium]
MNDQSGSHVLQILSCCRRLDALKLIAGIDGNVSLRAQDSTVWITRAGVRKSELAQSDILRVGEDGGVVQGEGRPSSELSMHLEIYKARPDIAAVVHAHPPVATGFAVAGLSFEADALPEVILSMGQVPLVSFAVPGSLDLARLVGETAKNYNAMLLANHGAVTMGGTMMEALNRMESLEHGAKILSTARGLGNVNKLDPDVVARLKSLSDGSNPVEGF